MLTQYAEFFTIHNAARGADALVVLSGSAETRFPRAVSLYRDGYASRILLTENRERNDDLKDVVCGEKDTVSKLVRFLNVKAPLAVVPSLKGGAASTFDEAYDLRHFCLKNGLKHLIIVTDNNHTRRALLAFRKIFKDSGIRVEAMGAENDIYNARNWWKSDAGIRSYVLEGIKLIVYLVSDTNASFLENY